MTVPVTYDVAARPLLRDRPDTEFRTLLADAWQQMSAGDTTKAMQLLERNLQDPEEMVRVSLGPNEALFKTERAMIYSRLVEGRYPAYREVFPKKQTAKIALQVGPFYTAVRQSAIMTDEESKRVVFRFEKKKLLLQARGAETGRSKVELAIARGKQLHDKRQDLKKADAQREIRRAMSRKTH